MKHLTLSNGEQGQGGLVTEAGAHGVSLWQARRYLFFLWRHCWILALSLLAFLGLGLAYNRWMPQSYASSARLWMPGDVRVAESAVYEDGAQLQDAGSTQAELIKSDLIQNRAMAELLTQGIAPFPSSAVKLKVAQVARTSLLEISAKCSSSNYVGAYLNAVMDQILAYETVIHDQQSEVTYASLSEQIAIKEEELKAQEEELTSYMRSNNVPALEENAKAASAYLTELLATSSRLAMEYELLKAATSDDSLVVTPDLISDSHTTGREDPEVQAMNELQKLKSMEVSFAKAFRPQHPKMLHLAEQIRQEQEVCDSLHLKNREQLAGTLNMVKLKLASTQEAIKDWEGKVNDTSERIADYERVKLSEERMRALCDHLRQMLQNVDVSRNLPRYSLSILDRAAPAKAVKLDPRLILSLALFFGFVSGLVLIRLVEMFSDRVTSVEYLNRYFGERVVGQIPEIDGSTKGAISPLTLQSASHVYAESFRSLRSSLYYFGNRADVPPRVMLVTSAIPKEGKSTVAANLATTFAFAGSRVLLLDADMRRGRLHSLFGLPQKPGLAELLSNDGDLDSYVRATSTKKLSLLSCGCPGEHIGELLLGAAFDRMLASARSSFDYVIVDSPPILATDDTANAASKTDGVIFVVRDSYTRSRAAERALRVLYDRRANILGIIYNSIRSASSTYCYPEYYSAKAPVKKGADVPFETAAE